jgi:predicted DNA binding CopG/RHH family protein
MSSDKKIKIDANLDSEEQEIEDNLNISKRLSPKKKAQELAKLKTAAKEHLQKRNKEKRISIRVFASDLEQLKEIAEQEGLPYQTLVTSILHKFSTGRLVPIEQVRHKY